MTIRSLVNLSARADRAPARAENDLPPAGPMNQFARIMSILRPLVLVTVLAVQAAREQNPKPLDIDAVIGLRSFPPVSGFVSATPDGRYVAYAAKDDRGAAKESSRGFYSPTGAPRTVGDHAAVWVVDTRTGKAREISAGKGTNWAPVWSPDGKHLAFFSDRDGRARLWIWERVSDRLRRVTAVVVRPGYGEPVWSPDGALIALSVLAEGASVEDENAVERGVSKRADPTVAPGAGVTV